MPGCHAMFWGRWTKTGAREVHRQHSALQKTSTVVFVLPIPAVWPEAMVGLSGYLSEFWRVTHLGLNLNILLLVV